MKLEDYRLKNWNGRNISNSVELDNLSILLLNLTKNPMLEKEGHRNLVAIDSKENIVWIADLPSTRSVYSFFNEIQMREGMLWAWCGSTLCIIDPMTGIIIKEQFVK